jgi:hypothetical protein
MFHIVIPTFTLNFINCVIRRIIGQNNGELLSVITQRFGNRTFLFSGGRGGGDTYGVESGKASLNHSTYF